MAVGIDVLLGILTLGLATSVVWACLYLNRSDRLALIGEKWRSMLPGGNKIADPQIMLEQTYQDLQDNFIQTREQFKSATSIEEDLSKQLLSAQQKLDSFDAWVATDMSVDFSTSDGISKKRQEIEALKEQLAQQQRKTAMLRGKLEDLEEEVQKAYTRKQVQIARLHADKATQIVERILSTTSPAATVASLAKLEADVAAREAEALGFINRLSKLFSQDAIKELEMQELDHMVPILPHAVEQLGKAIDHIVEAELEVEKRMKKNEEQFSTWTHRAEMALQQNNNDLAKQSLQRAKSYAAAVDLLATQLELMRQHNGELREKQAAFEGMVEKLSVRMAEMKVEEARIDTEKKTPNGLGDGGGKKQ